jgi:hypothetical protein
MIGRSSGDIFGETWGSSGGTDRSLKLDADAVDQGGRVDIARATYSFILTSGVGQVESQTYS